MRFLLAALIFATSAPAVAAERRYSITDFNRVEVDGPYQVTLTTGGSSSARATGSSAALDRLSVEVMGQTLRIRTNVSSWGGYPGAATELPSVTLTTRDLQAVSVNGSGKLTVDKAKGLKLTVSVVGSGQASIAAVDADNLFVSMLGSGQISLGGKAKALRAEVHGAANLDAGGLTASDVQLFADSAGNTKLNVSHAVTVQASGTGDVEVGGAPACTVKNSGSGQVRCGRR
jgi:hypothetical protein